MTKRQLIWLLPLVVTTVVICLLQSGILQMPLSAGVRAAETDPSVAALPVNVAEISSVDSYRQMRTFTGTVRARNRADLAFEFGGRITEVNFDEGDYVQQGDVIAVLDSDSLVARREATVASEQQALAVLAEMTAGPRKETIEAARANLEAATSELNRSETNLQRRKQLRDSGAISKEEYDQAAFTEKTDRANYQAAKQQLAEFLAGTRPEKIDAQKSAVNQLAASLSEIDVMLSKNKLVAPFAGTVARRFLDPGTIAAASAPVVRLIQQQHLEAWVGLPVVMVGDMKLGDPHEVTVNGIRYRVALSAKIPELDMATRTQTVLFDFEDETDQHVVPGQLCEISLETSGIGSGFWIPTSALSKGVRGLWSVMVAVPDTRSGQFRVEKRDVEIINTTESRVLARGTIYEGDLMVVDGIHRIADGQLVIPNKTN